MDNDDDNDNNNKINNYYCKKCIIVAHGFRINAIIT